MRLEPGLVRAFAEASGDRNPLHLDAEYARSSTFGRPIVHGALLAISALATLPRERLSTLSSVSASFTAPVFPGVDYSLHSVAAAGGAITVVAQAEGSVVARFRCTAPGADADAPTESAAGAAGRAPSREPAVWRPAELSAGLRWEESYLPAGQALRDLSVVLGAEAVPDRVLRGLAWVSWLSGMRMPGRDGLLAGFALSFSGETSGAGRSRVQVDEVDTRTGAVWLTGHYTAGDGSASASVRALLRSPVPSPTPESVGRHLEAGGRLAGHHVVVVGGSRGWGAAMAGALATQQATVWVMYSGAHRQAAQLRASFGSGRIRLHRCDAASPAEVGQLAQRLRQEDASLSAVVLAAAPPLRTTTAQPEAVPSQLDFIRASVALVATPLALLAPLLRPREGCLVVASSAALEDPPARLGHYVAAKAAVEGYASSFAAEHRLRALLVRAPKMRTDMVNGPTGSIGAAPPERVAAAATRAMLTLGDAEVTLLRPACQ